MKLRSFILVCCMVIVPGLAMFSHHVPAATWRSLWPVAGETTAAVAVQDAAAATPAAATPPPPPDATAGSAASPAAANAQTVLPRPGGPADGGQVAARSRLAALGATMIECQPSRDGHGLVLGSCRVPVDAAGQLERLFQVSAPDASTALEALADEVSAWRRRSAAP